MEILTTIISVSLLLALVVSPILIIFGLNKLKSKRKFIIYLISSIIITSIISIIFGWWSDTSYQILLSHYGYDFNAMNDKERFGNVAPKNMERVKSLEIGMMGVGWPVKVFITYVVYFPYLLIVYLIAYFHLKYKKKKRKYN